MSEEPGVRNGKQEELPTSNRKKKKKRDIFFVQAA